MKGFIVMNCIFKRIISIVVTIVMVFSVVALPGHAGWMSELIHDQQDFEEGYTPITTQQFITICDDINDAIEVALGVRLIPEEKMEVKVSGFMVEIFNGMTEATEGVVDCDLILKSLPSLKGNSNEIKSLLKLDMSVVDPALQEMANEYYAKDDAISGFATSLIRAYLKTIDSIEMYAVPVEGKPSWSELFIAVHYEYGEPDRFSTNIVYDAETQTLNSKYNTGVLDLGFVLDTDSYVISTAVNSWQRNFGFTVLYDVFVYLTDFFDYVTVRVHFTYDNREWMVQLWKGKYFIAPGGEIGIYTREIGSPGTFYNCAADEDMMTMSMKLYHKDNLIFELGPKQHWWLTGFKLAPKAYVPASLTLHGTIDFPTAEMANLFVENANKTGEIQATANGTHTSFVW